jgi:hypothetical protein
VLASPVQVPSERPQRVFPTRIQVPKSTRHTWTSCAEQVGFDAKTLRGWRRKQGAPQSPDPARWAKWIEATGRGASASVLDQLRLARLEETRERVQRLRRENAWGDKLLVKKSDIDQRDGQIALRQKQVLYTAVEGELPAQCEGQGAVYIRQKLRAMADTICDVMQGLLAEYEFARPPRIPDASTAEGRFKTDSDET